MINKFHNPIGIIGLLVLGIGIYATMYPAFGQSNQTQGSSSSGGTGELAMMALDLDQIETHVTAAQNAIANGDSVAALDALSQIENVMSTLEKQPKIMQDIKSIKDAISNNDMQKATEDITKIQGQISQVKTQNPALVENTEDENGDKDDN